MSIPQIADLVSNDAITYREPSLTYKVSEVDVTGKVDKIQAVIQSCRHILETERYSEAIYDESYGVELEQYIGKDYGFLVANIETTLRDALLQDDRVTDVNVSDVQKIDGKSDSVRVSFEVYTIFGSYQSNLNIVQ